MNRTKLDINKLIRKNSATVTAFVYFIISILADFTINQYPDERRYFPRMMVFIIILGIVFVLDNLDKFAFLRDVTVWRKNIIYVISILTAVFTDAYIHYISQYIGYEEPNNYNVALGKYVALIGVILLLLLYELKKNEFNAEFLEKWVIFNAFLIRIVYVINTGIDNAWSNDVGGYAIEDSGHLAYINTILTTGHFPNNPATGWEYPQPPLWHILCAGWARLNMLVFDKDRSFENLQYFSVFISIATIIVIYEIMKNLKISETNRLLVLGIVGFMPHFVLMSGNLNNDGLVTLFEVILVLLTIRYYEKSDVKTIILLALCFGLAMMAKLSVAVYAFPIGMVFIYLFVRDVIEESFKVAIRARGKHYILFALISGPLSLWWSVRLKLLYDLPFGYFQPMSGGEQYLGDFPLVKRLVGISHQLDQFDICRYNNQQNTDYNVFIMYIKYSIFGETYGAAGNAVATLLGGIAFALLVCIYVGALWYIVVNICKKKFKVSLTDVFLILVSLVPIGTLFIRALALETAQSCNMNIRFAMAGIMTFFVCAAKMKDDIAMSDVKKDESVLCSKTVLCFATVSTVLIVILLTI